MFPRRPNPRIAELDIEISRVLALISVMKPEDDTFTAAVDNWIKLCAERDKLLSNRFSKDQMLLVAGNVVIAVIVIGHERANVIATKIPQFLGKASR